MSSAALAIAHGTLSQRCMSPHRAADTRLNLAERRGDMASLAKGSECPSVNIFASMTAEARCPYLDFCLHRSLMTCKTAESVMPSIQAKMRPAIVIEVPLTPIPGVVTLLAERSQSPLVIIIFLMTRPAFRPGVLVSWVLMAILTGHIHMFAQ